MLTKFRNHIIKMTGFITQVASVRLTNFQNSYFTKNEVFQQGFLSVNVTKSAGNYEFDHIY